MTLDSIDMMMSGTPLTFAAVVVSCSQTNPNILIIPIDVVVTNQEPGDCEKPVLV